MIISSSSSKKSLSSMDNNECQSSVPKCCKLDSKECLSLSNILASFAAAINEEQAWALTYQTLLCAQKILNNHKDTSSSSRECSFDLVTHPDHLKIHKDGSVHPDSFLHNNNNPNPDLSDLTRTKSDVPAKDNNDLTNSKTKNVSECKIISKLGGVIFEALDYGMSDEDERQLSPEIDSLLDTMISADDTRSNPEENSDKKTEADDEGFGADSDDDHSLTCGATTSGVRIEDILGLCRDRLCGRGCNNVNSSDAHYKAVCRALVTEALELSEFLERVSQGTKQLRRPAGHQNYDSGRDSKSPTPPSSLQSDFDLDQLSFAIWARLWVQVIQSLRNGVKLKETKNNPRNGGCRPPVEYELTPYEILMDDIRSRRYKLKRVGVDFELPQRVKEDAHAKILEFIRSRPPLKNAAERKLGPPPVKELHPIEALMESIKQKPHLKPTPTKVRNSLPSAALITSIRNSRRQSSYGEMMTRSASTSERVQQNNLLVRTSSSFSTYDAVSNNAARPKKLIIPDFDLLYSLDKESDNDEDNECSGANKSNDSTGSLYYGHICPDLSQPSSPWEIVNESKPHPSGNKVDLHRRHTICSPNHLAHKDNNNSASFLFDCANNLANNPPIFHKQKTKDSKCMIT